MTACGEVVGALVMARAVEEVGRDDAAGVLAQAVEVPDVLVAEGALSGGEARFAHAVVLGRLWQGFGAGCRRGRTGTPSEPGGCGSGRRWVGRGRGKGGRGRPSTRRSPSLSLPAPPRQSPEPTRSGRARRAQPTLA